MIADPHLQAVVRVRVPAGLRGLARLDAELEAVEAELDAFAQTPSYDAGHRMVAMEAYALGLGRARQWIARARTAG